MPRTAVAGRDYIVKPFEHILLKLGVHGRAQAIALASEQDPATTQVLEAASLAPAPRPIN